MLGGRKETKEVSDILETEVADGDCLDRLMRARGELAILRSCTWESASVPGQMRERKVGVALGPNGAQSKGPPL